MRVLHINKFYPPVVGGIERAVGIMAQGQKAQGFRVEVLTSQRFGFHQTDSDNGIPVTRAASVGTYLSMPLSPGFPHYLAQKSRGKDILHFHFPFPLADISYLWQYARSRASTQTVVISWHSDIVRQKYLLWLYRPFLQHFLSLSNLILVSSERLRTTSPFLFPFQDKVRVLPYGLNLMDPFFAAKGSNGKKNSGLPIILFVGRLVPYKGVQYLIEAMKSVQGTLWVVGDGPLRSSLQHQAMRLGIAQRVKFWGYLPDEQLSKLYRQCDVFVLPSINRSEAFGIVQLEAMAFGKPVVNTELSTGATQVSLHGETGLSVLPRDSLALADAINLLIFDLSLRHRYSENGKQRIRESFLSEAMLHSLSGYYQESLTS
jgi:glycosyltransferase involved in cell wall biosynthesis